MRNLARQFLLIAVYAALAVASARFVHANGSVEDSAAAHNLDRSSISYFATTANSLPVGSP